MSNLTQHQLKFLGGLLDTSEASIRLQVYNHLPNTSGDYSKENLNLIGDEGERAATMSLIRANDSITGFWASELKAIDAAKQRMEAGHYGECMDCGESIDYQRLSACPTAQRCIHCQTLYEKMPMGNRYLGSSIHSRTMV